jgi:hypothetical protein
MLLLTVTSWLDRQEREILAYLNEENRVLLRQLAGRRLRLTDDDRRQLAARAYRMGRQALPNALFRWHRQLIARNALAVACALDMAVSGCGCCGEAGMLVASSPMRFSCASTSASSTSQIATTF